MAVYKPKAVVGGWWVVSLSTAACVAGGDSSVEIHHVVLSGGVKLTGPKSIAEKAQD